MVLFFVFGWAEHATAECLRRFEVRSIQSSTASVSGGAWVGTQLTRLC